MSSTFDYKNITVQPKGSVSASPTVSSVVIGPDDFVTQFSSNQIIAYVDVTIDTGPVVLSAEFSPDDQLWYSECIEDVSTAPATVSVYSRQFTTSGLYRIAFPVRDAYIRFKLSGDPADEAGIDVVICSA